MSTSKTVLWLTIANTVILVFFLIAGILAYQRYREVMNRVDQLRGDVRQGLVQQAGDLGVRLLDLLTAAGPGLQ